MGEDSAAGLLDALGVPAGLGASVSMSAAPSLADAGSGFGSDFAEGAVDGSDGVVAGVAAGAAAGAAGLASACTTSTGGFECQLQASNSVQAVRTGRAICSTALRCLMYFNWRSQGKACDMGCGRESRAQFCTTARHVLHGMCSIRSSQRAHISRRDTILTPILHASRGACVISATSQRGVPVWPWQLAPCSLLLQRLDLHRQRDECQVSVACMQRQRQDRVLLREAATLGTCTRTSPKSQGHVIFVAV